MATIKKRGNSYLLRCYNGYDVNGRQIEKTTTWHIPAGMSANKAEKEAMRQAILFEEKVRNGEVLGGVIKFKDFAEQWFRDYAYVQLRPQHLIRFYNKLAEPIAEKRYQCIVDFKALLTKKHITQAELIRKCD